MKKNLKLFVSSALVSLTFSISFATYGMDSSSDYDYTELKEPSEMRSRRQVIKKREKQLVSLRGKMAAQEEPLLLPGTINMG
jgi:hypothetical protein